MAYNGYLLKIGDYEIPHEYMAANTYSPYVNMQDLESYTDANGYLHRNAVSLKALKVEFDTPAMMTNTQFADLMDNISGQFTISKARQCEITAFIPEYNGYVTQTGYMADFTPEIYGILDGTIYYNACRLAFIGGVYS